MVKTGINPGNNGLEVHDKSITPKNDPVFCKDVRVVPENHGLKVHDKTIILGNEPLFGDFNAIVLEMNHVFGKFKAIVPGNDGLIVHDKAIVPCENRSQFTKMSIEFRQ